MTPTSPSESDLPGARRTSPDRGRETPLRDRLLGVAQDRASSARRIVEETSRILREWVLERPDERGEDGAHLELELSTWREEQAWRGPCATWLDSLRQNWHARAGEGLASELGAWIPVEGAGPNGRTARFPSLAALAEHAARDVSRGECVLVTSWSETVALALEAAWRAGASPEVLVCEGLPLLDGRRMARRLSRFGIPVTMVFDAALHSIVARADRVWLATEAVGAGALVARRGTACLLEECARREVPVRFLATSDKLMPGGTLRLPAWCARDGWLLWEDPPEGVRLETQAFEVVSLEFAGPFLTEVGLETASALHLRALRTDAAPLCGVRRPGSLVRTT